VLVLVLLVGVAGDRFDSCIAAGAIVPWLLPPWQAA
jgi:hypothetical protein